MQGRYPPGFSWTKDALLDGDTRLEAAYEVMAEVHTGKRKNGQPEIGHPILVFNLLRRFGCDDVQKAVGLLHDVREDGKQYDTPEKLHDELSRRVMEKCAPHTDAEKAALERWVTEVCGGVEQLTNGSYLYEGKRTWQVDHMRTIDERFKPIKMMDQASSVVSDGILSPNFRKNPDYLDNFKQWEGEKGFARKGFDVVNACMSKDFKTSDDLYKFYYFYMQVHSYFDEMYRLARDHVEGKNPTNPKVTLKIHEFSLAQLIDSTSTISWQRPPKVKAEKVIERLHPALARETSIEGLPEQGLTRITMSRKTGNVVGMGVIVAPDQDEDSPANQAANALRKKIESYERQRVMTGESLNPFMHEQGLEVHTEKKLEVRDFTVGPPLPLEIFIRLAQEAGAIDEAFIARIECMKKEQPPAMAR